MARRKNDPFSDDDETSDDGDEFELATHGKGLTSASGIGFGGQPTRKRMRRTKDEEIYGIFGDDDQGSEQEGRMGRTVRARDARGRKIDYRSGQAFVPASNSITAAEKLVEVSYKSTSDRELETDTSARRPTLHQDDEQVQEQEVGFQPASFYSTRQGIGSNLQREPRNPTSPQNKSARSSIGARAYIGSSSGDAEAGPSTHKSSLTSLSMFVSAGTTKPSDTDVPPHNITQYHSTESASAQPTQPEAPFVAQPAKDDEPDQGDAKQDMSAAGLSTSFSTKPPPIAPSSAFQRTDKSRPEPALPKTSIKFGSKFDPSAYLASMGWSGGGLGKSGQGIINPIEVQLRPERAGIAYGGLKEKTKQAKEEARRQGEPVSSDEEDRALRRKQEKFKEKERKKAAKEARAWTKPAEKKPRKPKIEHRTYEQIIAEIGALPTTHSMVGKIYDASSGEIREVADLVTALGRKGVLTAEMNQLPELQHNLKLICEGNAQTLTALAREGVQIQDRRRWLKRESEVARRKKEVEESKTLRVRRVLELVKRLESISAFAAEQVGRQGEQVLEEFTPVIQQLSFEYQPEISELTLDEAVVGAIAPILSVLWAGWKPSERPSLTVSQLGAWQTLLRSQNDLSQTEKAKSVMTSYETLLWTLWMPVIRRTLNEWKPHHPSSAVQLLEAWHPILPVFIWDNVVEQILKPKLHAGIAAWDARSSKWGLDHVVFPWLPLLGLERMGDVIGVAKRRLRSGLKMCDVEKGPSKGLGRWQKLFSDEGGDWDTLLLSTVVPRLGRYLKTQLTIDPTAQDMAPLNAVLAWRGVLRRGVLTRVLATDFFPKWLDVLYSWLKQSTSDLNEIADWYTFWREWFTKTRLTLDDDDPKTLVNRAFATGLNLINSALDLPSHLRTTKLVKSTFQLIPLPSSTDATPPRVAPHTRREEVEERVTFRSVLAEKLAENDLFLFKTDQVASISPTSTATVWRVSRSVVGSKTKSVLVYLDDEVVFLHSDSVAEVWMPVSLADLISAVV